MRFMLKVQVPTEAGNQALQSGKLPEVVGGFLETYRPESAYFLVENGQRTMVAFVNMDDVSQMPAMGEPFFLHLGAQVTFTPAMNAEDLKTGLSKVFPGA